MPRLIIDEDQQKRYVRLTREVTTIGRADDNAVRIADIKSSRHHCEIQREGDGYILVDLESQNGTRVNDVRVARKTLSAGDVIQIGSTNITFTVERDGLPGLDAPAEAEPQRASSPQLPAAEVVTRRRRGGRRRKKRRHTSVAAPHQAVEAIDSLTRLRATLNEVLRELATGFGDEGIAEAHAIFEKVLERQGETLLRRYQERIATLERLADLIGALNSELDLQRVLERLIDAAIELTGAERGFLILDEGQERMNIEVARNFDRSSLAGAEIQLSRSIARRVASSGEAVIAADAREDDRFADFRSVMALELKSVLCLPLRDARGEVIGVVYLDSRSAHSVFADHHLEILEHVADQAAIAIANARLHRAAVDRQREVEELARKLEETVHEQKEIISQQRSELETRYTYDQIVGAAPAMRKVFHLLDRVTDSRAPVLIHGESGTGKELVARAIHFNGPRREGPFVSENCAAISESVLESELFGHVKGAFTGADRNKKGLFELADGGTLFLDEIGDMSPGMQVKLLRALQEGVIRPVGSKETVTVDARIISASNRNLRQMVDRGEFREDLLYRVNAITVDLPPLRDRKDDIPLLADHLLAKLCEQDDAGTRQLNKGALARLMSHEWPGNIRELENELRRAIALSEDTIGVEHLSEHLRALDSGFPVEAEAPALAEGQSLKDAVRQATAALERRVIEAILIETGGKKAPAARRLGISRPTLDSKIEALGIRLDALRDG